MIKAVFFDLDGTLFDRDGTVGHLLEEQYSAFASSVAPILREDFIAAAVLLDDHGRRGKSEAYATLCAQFGLSALLGNQLAVDFWSRYHRLCRPFPRLIETLQELRRRGKKLGVITNGTSAVQEGTIDALSIRSLLDAILISGAEGVRKPSPEIFERAAARVGLRATECCYVGDDPAVDVAGAGAAGFHPIWRRTPYWVAPATIPVADTLPDVLSYV